MFISYLHIIYSPYSFLFFLLFFCTFSSSINFSIYNKYLLFAILSFIKLFLEKNIFRLNLKIIFLGFKIFLKAKVSVSFGKKHISKTSNVFMHKIFTIFKKNC
ncbi:hypothetical protein PA0709 [Candidatus Phytoplasma australiense]|uniref:Uncharacterized protein n=1 Tax=Phytoplasma australiense TaxID=59748 RepID=B1VAS0_PHYAS|nr:hypothetical protein PA0709 [Candidatus Phytoplasma australiense]